MYSRYKVGQYDSMSRKGRYVGRTLAFPGGGVCLEEHIIGWNIGKYCDHHCYMFSILSIHVIQES